MSPGDQDALGRPHRSVFSLAPMIAMKTWLAAGLFLAISGGISAAPFQNLGFDIPKITPQRTFDYGSTADVLPGWQVYYDDAPQPIIGFNGTHVFPDDLTDIDL